MRLSMVARFMQLNGAITGWREGGIRWLQVSQRTPVTLASVLGGQHYGRQSPRIASTAVRMNVPARLGASLHAPVRDAG
jgi:hypothetical protein